MYKGKKGTMKVLKKTNFFINLEKYISKYDSKFIKENTDIFYYIKKISRVKRQMTDMGTACEAHIRDKSTAFFI